MYNNYEAFKRSSLERRRTRQIQYVKEPAQVSASPVKRMNLFGSPARSNIWHIEIFSHYSTTHTSEQIIDYLFYPTADQLKEVQVSQLITALTSTGSTKVRSVSAHTWTPCFSHSKNDAGGEVYRFVLELQGFEFSSEGFIDTLQRFNQSLDCDLVRVLISSEDLPVVVCGTLEKFINCFTTVGEDLVYSRDVRTIHSNGISENERKESYERINTLGLQWLSGWDFQRLRALL